MSGLSPSSRALGTKPKLLEPPIHVHSRRVTWLVAGDRDHVFSSTVNGPIRKISLQQSATAVASWKVYDQPVRRVVWGPNGKTLATAGGAPKMWDVDSKKEIGSLIAPHKGIANDIAWQRKTDMIATIDNKTISFWDGATKKHLSSVAVPASGRIEFSPTEPIVAVSGATVHLFEATSGKSVWSNHDRNFQLRSAFSPNGKWLCSESPTGTVWLFDVERGKLVFNDAASRRSPGRGTGVSWSADNKLFAVGHDTVRIYSADTHSLAKELSGHRGQVIGVAFDPTGNRIASIGNDKRLIIWDAATGTQLVHLHTARGEEYQSLAWSPDGRRISIGCKDGTVQIWGSPEITAPVDTRENGL